MRLYTRRTIIRGVGVGAPMTVLAPRSQAANADPLPLAINGYDPVAYFTTGTPTRGLREFEYEWDEQRYRFANDAHRNLFKASPARYAPRFANFCAMALAKGFVHEANPEYWLISDGTLYLFAAEYGPKLFQQDISGHAAQADKNRPSSKR